MAAKGCSRVYPGPETTYLSKDVYKDIILRKGFKV